MRIAIVSEYYYPSIGGVQEHVHHFALEAVERGHEVTIVTSAMPDLAGADGGAREGLNVLRIARSRPVFQNGSFGRVSQGLGVSQAMAGALRDGRFDIVHVHCPLTPVLPLVALHHAACPVVGTFHTHFVPGPLFRLAAPLLQRYLDRLDAAIAVSNACLTPLRGRLRARVQVVPNGVDTRRFGAGRRLAQFDDGKLNLLWVGRLEPRNGLDQLLAAFQMVREEVDARLLVVGDGPLLPRYVAAVPRQLARDVVFAGRLLDARPDWYASADIYCAPATIASFGVTLLEAMAAGSAILASDIDGFREVLRHGAEGELVPPDDPRAWASAILRLARAPERRRAYGERGRETAERFAWPRIASRVLETYRSLGVGG